VDRRTARGQQRRAALGAGTFRSLILDQGWHAIKVATSRAAGTDR
jgi:hypothetical protein